MKKPLRALGTLCAALLAGVCGLAADAAAGQAVRILVETPPGLEPLEPGQSVDVQIVGVDASGARVGFDDARVDVSLSPANDGALDLVEAPYRYRYVAPSRIDSAHDVQVRARLARKSDVAGTATIRIAPVRVYANLELRGPAVVEYGSAVAIDVLGVRADGTTEPVGDRTLVAVVDGPGAVERVSPGVLRYIAPQRPELKTSRSVARVRAWLERNPNVQGELTITTTRDAAAVPPAGPPPRSVARLAVELPQGVTSVEAGQAFDVQIAAFDASGARVPLGDLRVEASATEGEIALLTPPDRFHYEAPPVTDGVPTTQIRAWLKRTPDVSGAVAVPLVGRRPFDRLVVRGATSVAAGGSIDVEVLGVRADGNAVGLRDHPIVVTVEGPGTIARVGPSAGAHLYRYTAPAGIDARGQGRPVRIVAALEHHPSVVGESTVFVGGDAPKSPADDEDEGAVGVLWPSGNVRLLVARAKSGRDDDWPRNSVELPAPGRPIVVTGGVVRLRIQPERADVRKIELEWYVLDRPGTLVHVDGADTSGRLRLVKNKAGRTHAIVETEVPEGDKPLVLSLLLTTEKGEILKEEFRIQREPPSRR